MKIIRKSCS